MVTGFAIPPRRLAANKQLPLYHGTEEPKLSSILTTHIRSSGANDLENDNRTIVSLLYAPGYVIRQKFGNVGGASI